MVISRREIKRKRKETTSTCSLLDDSPKRTKVHAQRKFAQGSNVSSPVITPVKEIEKQEKVRPDVLPEPQELLPMNRPHTEDFLTFLCFRGTSMLPPNLNFFNTAPVDSREHTQPLKHEPIDVCPPLANLSAKTTAGTSERPFIAFGVRKRADPILVSKHMDKKRRHALALQTLRRKYQEQKMAKIRAVTISKLSEKTTTKNLVRTRSVTKNETTTKKSLTQKTRVKIVATKHVHVTTRSSIKTPIRAPLSTPIRTQIQKRMCLRSFRGRFIQRELNMQKPKKKPPNRVLKKQEVKTETKKKKEASSEFSSDDDQPLVVKTVKVVKPSNKVPLPKVAKKVASTPKKPVEISFRVTRASRPLLTTTRDQTIKRKIQISRTLPTKSPFVKLTPPKPISPKQKQKEEKSRFVKTRKSERLESHEEDEKLHNSSRSRDTTEEKPQKSEKDQKKKTADDKKKADILIEKDSKKKEKPASVKKSERFETNPGLRKKLEITVEKDVKRKTEVVIEKDIKKRSEVNIEKGIKKKSEINIEKEIKKKSEVNIEKDIRRRSEVERDLKKKTEINIEKDVKKKVESSSVEKELKKKSEINLKQKQQVDSEKVDLKKKGEVNAEKNLKKKVEVNTEKDLKKKLEINPEKNIKKKQDVSPEKDLKKKQEVSPEDLKKKQEINQEKESKKKLEVNLEKDLKKKTEVILEKDSKTKTEVMLENDSKKKSEVLVEKGLKNKLETSLEKELKANIEKDIKKNSEINIEKDTKKKPEICPEKETKKKPEISIEKETKKTPEISIEKDIKKKPEVDLEKDLKKKPEITVERDLRKKSDTNTEKEIKAVPEKDVIKKAETTIEKDLKQNAEVNPEKDSKKNPHEVNIEKDLKKKTEINTEKEIKRKSEITENKELKKKIEIPSDTKKPENAIQELVETEKKNPDNLPEKKQKPNNPGNIENKNLDNKTEITTEKKKAEIVADKKKLDKVESSADKDGTKKKPTKSETLSEKKKLKNETIEEPKVSQRPSRKTKEAAAIYMEILGHKLVNEGDIDDDSISIDSFPELPNVRKTEQRENELKAKAKSKNIEVTDKNLTKVKSKKLDINELEESNQVKPEDTQKKETDKIKSKDIFSDSDSSIKRKKKGSLLKMIEPAEVAKRSTRGTLLNKEPELQLNIPLSVPEKVDTTGICKDGNQSAASKPVEINPTPPTTGICKDGNQSAASKPVEINPTPPTTGICKDGNQSAASKPVEINPTPPNPKTRLPQTLEDSSSDSDESTTSKTNQNPPRNTKRTKKLTKAYTIKLDNSFSDSDEEPLSKLTVPKSKQENEASHHKPVLKRKSAELDAGRKEPALKQIKKDSTKMQEKKREEPATLVSTKPKRECTKRPQNYLTLFSSSEDEEKYFHGFVKNETAKQPAKTVKQETKCHQTASADLLCKDVDKRFGKGKVNMSTEQIEKWLKDSALAGGAIKKESFDEKNPLETNLDLSLPTKIETDIKQSNIKKIETVDVPEKSEMKIEHESKSTIPVKPTELPSSSESLKQDKQQQSLQATSKPTERKTIFRKERKILKPNISAFSPNNESSVYAFEADNEDAISTPFRRPTRRPSSTATSRSEDSSKYEESSKTIGKFRLPSAVKQDPLTKSANKQEVSLMLSTDESNNTTSIAVQLDLDSTEVFPDPIITQTETEDSEQLFYIPLQPGKQSSSQVIQGVAVKLGTKGANGPNQRVVMSAKLVTHTPVGAQKLLEKPLAASTPMYPPTSTVQKSKLSDTCAKGLKSGRPSDRTSETSEDIKYKVPSSPSASSSSSTKITKRQHMKTRIRPFEFLNPVHSNEFPSSNHSTAALLEAPVFYPNEKEFQDPLEYIEKIKLHAEKFGICRIVPPSNFKPECKVTDDMRFTAYNQYVHKMMHRWGPNFKELMAITKYLETQNIALTHPPWIGGMEIDLPRLYQIVQSLGGLKEVIEKKKWPKVSELMKIPKSAQDRVTKLDDIYCKYLLPYDTLSPDEREKLFDEVETEWAKRESRALLKSQQKIINRDASPNSESDSGDESDECIVKGRNMALNAFYRIARNTMSMWFKTMEPPAQEVEQEFWKHVTLKQNHICVHSGSIDSGSWGYGFSVMKNSPFARHAWNLKVLTNNSSSVLRYMAPVMGVTVPTLHVGMVFSACCWYRDPHSLPWIEYLHTGGNKIWYGIPDSMSEVFHSTLIKLVPNYCRNKSLWLPSDTAMVPPSVLVENGVSLCRTIQEPGQFIVVFPKAFTSSLCTGYVVSESVYFAPLSWLTTAQKVFDELQDSCEPSMFSLEKLLISIAQDGRASIDILKQIIPAIELLCEKETLAWRKLQELGLNEKEKLPLPEVPLKKRKKLQNDSGDYECEICCKNLFVSWVIESQEGIYCLEHAIEYIEKKKMEIQNCKLTYTCDSEELKNLIEKVKSTIEMKLQKKVSGKNT